MQEKKERKGKKSPKLFSRFVAFETKQIKTKQNVLFLRTGITAGDGSSSSFCLWRSPASLVCERRGCAAGLGPGEARARCPGTQDGGAGDH